MKHPSPKDRDSYLSEDFPVDGGNLGELIRARDWSSTPLGPVQDWPLALCTSLQNALNTSFASAIMWGDDLLQLYNDSFAQLMGEKHPQGLGRPTRENWSETWDKLEPLLEGVRRDRHPVWQNDMLLEVNRKGFLEHVYFTFSFSPIFGTSGNVEGIQIIATETTEQVLNRQRLEFMHHLGQALYSIERPQDVLHHTAELLEKHPREISNALIYVQNSDVGRAELVEAIRIPRDTNWSPPWINLASPATATSKSQGPFGLTPIGSNGDVINLHREFGPPPEGLSDPIPRQALVLPLSTGRGADEICVGYLVFGANPMLELDDHYRRFLSELARSTSSAYDYARKHEEELDVSRAQAELVRQQIESRHLQERAHLLDSIDDPFYALDRQWRITYANAAVNRAPHWPSTNVTGRNLWDVFPQIRGTKLEEVFRRAMDMGESGDIEIYSSSRRRHFRIRVYPWEKGLSVALRDITEIKRFQQELIASKEEAEEMTRLKSILLSNMSHELRTPLTSIIGMANVLAEKAPPRFRSYAIDIEEAGRRLAGTLDSVLTLAQMEGDAVDLEFSDVDIVEETRRSVRSLQYLATEKNLSLEFENPEAAYFARVDPAFVDGILNNLVGNAIKFTNTGSVRVRVEADEERVSIIVDDTGIGIGPNFLPRLFDEFRQESTGHARSHEGVGLGLTIVNRMVKAMNGTISVLSTKGVGSTFTVTFPRVYPVEISNLSPSTKWQREPQMESVSGRPSLLAVEDDDAIRTMVELLLENDFDITTAPDAETALRRAADEHFDIVLLDIGLPGIDGIEALHRLRDLPAYRHCPIIALSGYAMPDDRRRFVEEGFTDYIAKPFLPDDLRDSIRAHI